MTISEAIRILNNCLVHSGSEPMGPLPQALQLGSEALDRLKAWRNDNDENLLWDLPGETEE